MAHRASPLNGASHALAEKLQESFLVSMAQDLGLTLNSEP